MAGWYVRRGENVIGPIETVKLKELAAAGKLLPTDQLAKDAAGPWTEARRTPLFAEESAGPPPGGRVILPPAPPPLPFAPTAERQPVEFVQDQVAGDSKTAVVVRTGKAIIVTVGQGALAVGGAVSRAISARAQRRHELKLVKIQAQAAAQAQRPPQPTATAPGAPITFAPQMIQTTVVKVINRNSGGCGCSGCAMILLLILLAIWAVVHYSNKNPSSQNNSPISEPGRKESNGADLSPVAEPKHYQELVAGPFHHYVWIDPRYKYDPSVYEQAIADFATDMCNITFWDDRARIPLQGGAPLSDEQVESRVAVYERNRSTGRERFYYLRNGNMVEPFGVGPSTTPIPALAAPKPGPEKSSPSTVMPPTVSESADAPTPSAETPKHKMRIWTSSDGKSLEAQFLSYAYGTVVLKKADGTVVKVPIERFGEQDQVFIRKGARE